MLSNTTVKTSDLHTCLEHVLPHPALTKFADYNFKDRKALVRVDFNLPMDDKNEIADDNRMRAVIPTIKKILGDGGSVILMSHMGRPKGGPDDKFSLRQLLIFEIPV